MPSFARRFFLFLLACGHASAHVVSVSNGELLIDGRNATYQLRMPDYEIENLANPEIALLDELRLAGATRTSSNCKTDDGWYICDARYEFAEDVADTVNVECMLYRVTVPNHVHILYAARGENSDQKVFDQNTSMAEMRFHPPSLGESITRDGSAGALRLLKSFAALLFLVTLALASRSWKEALLLSAAFLIAQWLVRLISPFIPIGMSPEFLEAVLALTAAYLAAELIFLPDSRSKWIIVPIFGLIHGLPFAGFPPLYLAGAVLVQLTMFVILVFAILKLPMVWRKRAAIALCLIAAGWFARLVL